MVTQGKSTHVVRGAVHWLLLLPVSWERAHIGLGQIDSRGHHRIVNNRFPTVLFVIRFLPLTDCRPLDLFDYLPLDTGLPRLIIFLRCDSWEDLHIWWPILLLLLLKFLLDPSLWGTWYQTLLQFRGSTRNTSYAFDLDLAGHGTDITWWTSNFSLAFAHHVRVPWFTRDL